MRVSGWVSILLLAASARAQEPGLDSLFSPGNRQFALRPYGEREFERLSAKQRLVARGLDPASWKVPPKFEDQVPHAMSVRPRLLKGFDYAARLLAKRQAFDRAARRVPLEDLIRRLPGLGVPEPMIFYRRHVSFPIAFDVGGRGKIMQPLNALRHAERQFQAWFLDELSDRIRSLSGRERTAAIERLAMELHRSDAGLRMRCARVLGGLSDSLAAMVLERAVERERDADVVGALIAARVRCGGEWVQTLLMRWAKADSGAVRRAAIRACAGRKGRWVQDLLRRRLAEETGRLKSDVEFALGAEQHGGVRFYGIPTHSRRVLFLIDVSGSMAFPLDGKNGEREPRFWRTTRELRRTLEGLPRGVRFGVTLFAATASPWQGQLVESSPANAATAMEFVEKAQPGGGTNMHAALAAAFASDADTVFLLTDGEASVGPIVDPALLLEEVSAQDPHGRVVFHTVGLSRDQNVAFLVNLAQRTRGRYVADR